MQLFLTIIAFVVIFSLLVLVHELGHFFFAKRAKIRVDEFGLGLPPRIYGIKKGETLYSLNAIPFGGFVRLFGEDMRDPQALRSKRSFVSKSLRQRFFVVIGGILMNFLLALVLLSICFSVGIKPLIVTPEDMFGYIRSGSVVLEPGTLIKTVQPDSFASSVSLFPGDQIVSVNGRVVSDPTILVSEKTKGKPMKLIFSRNGVAFEKIFENQAGDLGLELYHTVLIPRLRVSGVFPYSDGGRMGLRPNDVILKVNNKEIFYLHEFESILNTSTRYLIEIWRDGRIDVASGNRTLQTLVVGDLLPKSVAYENGFQIGDVIVSIDNKPIFSYEDITSIRDSIKSRTVSYVVLRNGFQYTLMVPVPKSGQIGIYLSPLGSVSRLGIEVFESSLVSSVTEVKDIRFPLYQAPLQAWYELKRLTKFSFSSLKDLFYQVVVSQTVPEDVGGPLRIAQMTYTFVDEGFWSLVRFTALLSMSLAVLNIVPIPALDGGRLLFLVIEFIRGKPGNPRLESSLQAIGVMFLIALIVLVTYNDILNFVKP